MEYALKNPTPLILSVITFVATITTAANAQTRIESIATALSHFSVIELPPGTTVENVAVGVGPSDVLVQFQGRHVLVKPLKAGIKTDMAIFTDAKTYNYEILPAGDPAEMSMVLRAYDEAELAAKRQSQMLSEKMKSETDVLNTRLMMTTKAIDDKAIRKQKHGINVKVMLVGQDEGTYYVRIQVVNNSNHTYRLEAPKVIKIDPTFDINVAYRNLNRQLSDREFRKFRAYQQTAVDVSGATIAKQDMTPDTVTDFVLSIQKPAVTPAIFRFDFPSDDGLQVNAVAIF
jgi:hypothetical protein